MNTSNSSINSTNNSANTPTTTASSTTASASKSQPFAPEFTIPRLADIELSVIMTNTEYMTCDLTANELKLLILTNYYARFYKHFLTPEEKKIYSYCGFPVSAKNESGDIFWNAVYINFLTKFSRLAKNTIYSTLKKLIAKGHIHPKTIPNLTKLNNFDNAENAVNAVNASNAVNIDINWDEAIKRIQRTSEILKKREEQYAEKAAKKAAEKAAQKNTPPSAEKNTSPSAQKNTPSVPQRRVMTSFEAQFAEYLDEAEKYVRELEEKENKESKENKASGESKENKVG